MASDKNTPIDISKDSDYISLFQREDVKTVIELYDFYLYKIANDNDCPMSYGINSSLSWSQKDSLYEELLESASINDSALLFDSILRNKIKDIRLMELSDTTLKCDRIKGFFHINSSGQGKTPQHKIDALFKHIRDSFAHGRIAICNDYLIMEDKTNEMTARLIITLDVLKRWIGVIGDFISVDNTEANA